MGEAKKKGLRVAEGILLPLDYVTKTCAILAQRRKGKTYLGCDLAEELVAAELPWVALDPTGAWWGLRSSADGKHAGLPVVVIGGQHGDLPLERDGGAVIADLVLDHPGWYVLDLSLLESRAAEREFTATFGDRLHRRKMQPGMDFPLHLFVDEADLFVPQEKETTWNSGRGSRIPDVLAVYGGIVRRGGLHGLGSTLISQRPALINKNALTQIDLLFLLRLVAGQDQDAVYKNNVSRFLPKTEALALMATLATLPIGEGWILEPGADPPTVERVRFRERQTFNSSATPKPGERRVEPSVFAEIDLDELRAGMESAIERARQDDPAELRRRLRDAEARGDAQLRRADELERALADRPETVVEPTVVGVPVATVDDLDKIWEAIRAARETARAAKDGGDRLVAELGEVARPLAEAITRAAEAAENGRVGGAVEERRVTTGAGAAAPAAPPTRPEPLPPSPSDDLGTGARHLLATLGHYHPIRLSVGQLALLARRKARGGAWNTSMKQLRDGSYVVESAGAVVLTDRGVAASGANPSTLSGEALRERWREALPPAAADIFDRLVEAYPDGRSIESLAEETERAPRGGSWNTAIATLVRNDLAVREGDVLYATAEAAGAGG